MEQITFWCIWCQPLWGSMCCITCGLLTSSRDSWLAKWHSFELFPANVWEDLQYVFLFGRVFANSGIEGYLVGCIKKWGWLCQMYGFPISAAAEKRNQFTVSRLRADSENSAHSANSADSADSAESAEESISESSPILGISYCVLARCLQAGLLTSGALGLSFS